MVTSLHLFFLCKEEHKAFAPNVCSSVSDFSSDFVALLLRIEIGRE
jgi:hypothetical protein